MSEKEIDIGPVATGIFTLPPYDHNPPQLIGGGVFPVHGIISRARSTVRSVWNQQKKYSLVPKGLFTATPWCVLRHLSGCPLLTL